MWRKHHRSFIFLERSAHALRRTAYFEILHDWIYTESEEGGAEGYFLHAIERRDAGDRGDERCGEDDAHPYPDAASRARWRSRALSRAGSWRPFREGDARGTPHDADDISKSCGRASSADDDPSKHRRALTPIWEDGSLRGAYARDAFASPASTRAALALSG